MEKEMSLEIKLLTNFVKKVRLIKSLVFFQQQNLNLMQQNGIPVYRAVKLRHLSPTLRHFRGPIPVCWIPMDTNSTIPLHWIKTYLWQEESFNFLPFSMFDSKIMCDIGDAAWQTWGILGWIYLYIQQRLPFVTSSWFSECISSSNNLSRPIVQHDWDLNVYVSA